MTLQDILKLGTDGILAVGVWALWMRLTTVEDRLFKLLEDGQAERAAIAHQVGLTTQDLRAAADAARARSDGSAN